MRTSFKCLGPAFVASVLAAGVAHAHAFLDSATPAVGATVAGGPGELTLRFTQNVVPAFCSVKVSAAGGGPIPAEKASVDPGSPNTLHVRLGRALKPGGYTVSWHVVSVDTHPTSGTYTFTVSP